MLNIGRLDVKLIINNNYYLYSRLMKNYIQSDASFIHEKHTFNICPNKWRYILRANDPAKCIAPTAIFYISLIEFLFRNNPNEIILTSALLKSKSHHKQTQRGRFLKQINHIYNIKYHHVYKYEGKKRYRVFAVTRTENSKAILGNPKLFFKNKKVAKVIQLAENISVQANLYSSKMEGTTYGIKEKFHFSNIDLSDLGVESIMGREELADLNLDKAKTSEVIHFKPKPSIQQRKLIEFYPLNEEDVLTLQTLSGREFNANFINQLLMKFSKKYPEHTFYSKQLFFKYFQDVLRKEMRTEEKVNNEWYTIMNLDTFKVNQFLDKIETESIKSPHPDKILKTKIACTLDPEDAYRLLYGCFITIDDNKKTVNIATRTKLPLSEPQQNIITQGIRAIGLQYELTMSVAKSSEEYASKNAGEPVLEKTALILPNNAWGKLRKRLIDYYGEDGRSLDDHWFSKLDANINEEDKVIEISSSSRMTVDWIQDKYSRIMEEISSAIGFNIRIGMK